MVKLVYNKKSYNKLNTLLEKKKTNQIPQPKHLLEARTYNISDIAFTKR